MAKIRCSAPLTSISPPHPRLHGFNLTPMISLRRNVTRDEDLHTRQRVNAEG